MTDAPLLYLGDCLGVLRTLPDCSVDAVVTDPPYGLAFMGKRWDYDVPSVDVWAECLRVLKPGGHLLAFAGTRTQHRMAVRIEDAGFEIRDMIAWVYGSGFPKSLDVSKAIDKNNGETGRLHKFTAWMRTTRLSAKQINDATGTFMGSHYLTSKSQPAIPTPALWSKLRPMCGEVPAWVDELVERIAAEREVVGIAFGKDTSVQRPGIPLQDSSAKREFPITAPATPEAQQWAGWGTALKPALEPITVARKPLAGTVAENVLLYGTGGLNVDGCRVGTSKNVPASVSRKVHANCYMGGWKEHGETPGIGGHDPNLGRWPANLIHDGSDEVVGCFPQTTPSPSKPVRQGGGQGYKPGAEYGAARIGFGVGYGDSGSAARFFYCAKASKADRGDGNMHPTVKPTELMRHLCRLVTPPGGVVLDPFMGSGSTGKAAVLEGFDFIGIERDPAYHAIAEQRINQPIRHQPSLFNPSDHAAFG